MRSGSANPPDVQVTLCLSCRAVPLVARPLTVVFLLINYALILGGNPYEGMTGEEVFNFVASGQRMYRTSAMTSELYVYIIAPYSLPQVKVISIRKCSTYYVLLYLLDSTHAVIGQFSGPYSPVRPAKI